MVFLDDSEYEIGLVQKELPEVMCVKMDAQRPAHYAKVLQEMTCFYRNYITDEDRLRTSQYQSTKKRQTCLEETTDLAEYHINLKTELDIRPAEDFDLPRIAQLAIRTNQCNLAGTHPNLFEIRQIAEDENQLLLRLHASDIYGDMGIVGAAVLKKEQHRAGITHFWLSCRVFHRGFEDELLARLRKSASDLGYNELFGIYISTEKNRLFADFYERNGVKLYE